MALGIGSLFGRSTEPEPPRERLRNLRLFDAQRRAKSAAIRLEDAKEAEASARAALDEVEAASLKSVARGGTPSANLGNVRAAHSKAAEQLSRCELIHAQSLADLEETLKTTPSDDALLELDERVEAALGRLQDALSGLLEAVLDADRVLEEASRATDRAPGIESCRPLLGYVHKRVRESVEALKSPSFSGWRFLA